MQRSTEDMCNESENFIFPFKRSVPVIEDTCCTGGVVGFAIPHPFLSYRIAFTFWWREFLFHHWSTKFTKKHFLLSEKGKDMTQAMQTRLCCVSKSWAEWHTGMRGVTDSIFDQLRDPRILLSPGILLILGYYSLWVEYYYQLSPLFLGKSLKIAIPASQI